MISYTGTYSVTQPSNFDSVLSLSETKWHIFAQNMRSSKKVKNNGRQFVVFHQLTDKSLLDYKTWRPFFQQLQLSVNKLSVNAELL